MCQKHKVDFLIFLWTFSEKRGLGVGGKAGGHRDSSLDGWPVYFQSLALPKLKENANFVKVTYFLTLPTIPTP